MESNMKSVMDFIGAGLVERTIRARDCVTGGAFPDLDVAIANDIFADTVRGVVGGAVADLDVTDIGVTERGE